MEEVVDNNIKEGSKKKTSAKSDKKPVKANKKKGPAKNAKKNPAVSQPKGEKIDPAVTNTVTNTTPPPPPPNSLLANATPDMVINVAIGFRDSLLARGKNTDRALLKDQIYNPQTGILKKLHDMRPSAGAKVGDFNKIVAEIESLASSLLGGATTTNTIPDTNATGMQHMPASNHSTFIEQAKVQLPPSVIEKPLSPKESLEKQFNLIYKHLENYRATRLCHANNVDDFCKLNTRNGFVFSFDREKEILKCTYLGGDLNKEKEFKLSK